MRSKSVTYKMSLQKTAQHLYELEELCNRKVTTKESVESNPYLKTMALPVWCVQKTTPDVPLVLKLTARCFCHLTLSNLCISSLLLNATVWFTDRSGEICFLPLAMQKWATGCRSIRQIIKCLLSKPYSLPIVLVLLWRGNMVSSSLFVLHHRRSGCDKSAKGR
jgi:hypothetical protein